MGGKERFTHGFFKGNLKERDHLEDPVLDGRRVLKLISWLTFGTVDLIDMSR
jgi:hypothetical protein